MKMGIQPRHLALPGDAWVEALPHELGNYDEAEPRGACNKAEPCYKKSDSLAMDAHFHGHDGMLRLKGYSFAEITSCWRFLVQQNVSFKGSEGVESLLGGEAPKPPTLQNLVFATLAAILGSASLQQHALKAQP